MASLMFTIGLFGVLIFCIPLSYMFDDKAAGESFGHWLKRHFWEEVKRAIDKWINGEPEEKSDPAPESKEESGN